MSQQLYEESCPTLNSRWPQLLLFLKPGGGTVPADISNHFIYILHYCSVVRDGSVGIATTLRPGRSGERYPVEARFSAPIQTYPGAHPDYSTMGTGSFPGVKRPGRGVDYPLPSSAEYEG